MCPARLVPGEGKRSDGRVETAIGTICGYESPRGEKDSRHGTRKVAMIRNGTQYRRASENYLVCNDCRMAGGGCKQQMMRSASRGGQAGQIGRSTRASRLRSKPGR